MARTPSGSRPGRGAVERGLLLTAVVLAGAAVMIYEFIAVRVLQRYFGGRLEVWASVIAVVMAGLALGSYLGGHAADRYHSTRVLGAGIVIAGMLGALILPAAELAGEHLLRLDVVSPWHPLVAAAWSSFLPFLMLGAALPQVIRFYVADFASVGRAAGTVTALSTVGSIGGVLGTGMYLLASFGVRETLYATSAALVGVGVAVTLLSRRAAVASLAMVALLCPSPDHAEIVFDDYSAYHHILVEDAGDTRILWFDNDQESLMSLGDPYAGGFEYTDFFHVPMLLDPSTDQVLFVGLGGGTGPKSFLSHYPAVGIDVVEIDPMVVEVARRYFAVPEDPRLRIHVADGRAHLRRDRRRYGAIVVDAYSAGPYGGVLPYHLATREFFETVRQHLTNGGSLVYNVITTYGEGTVLPDVYETIASVFPSPYAFQAATSLNVVIVAQRIDAEESLTDGGRGGREWPEGPWLDHPLGVPPLQVLAGELMSAGRRLPSILPHRLSQAARIPPHGRILTDDYAPTDTAPR
ncbi:MAG: fused MFS/spermidine synthase [Chloroflexi bacterium]|nr:fused MFS/spermidine synthase [Chloroflexota bacterium]